MKRWQKWRNNNLTVLVGDIGMPETDGYALISKVVGGPLQPRTPKSQRVPDHRNRTETHRGSGNHWT
ncbi:MAG: hypothetical protein QOF72_1898 [Blastocatellia bacterium]|nr:hypothetical protein [Blastocatellia bacterium]